jgi:DNA-binding NtrC family response regulator
MTSMIRILLVDDDAGVRELVSAVLKSHGYSVVTATDGEEGRDLIMSNEHFDLVLSDIDMARMNGIALLRHVCIERPGLPMVMLTGNATLETASEAVKLGAYDYIQKPLDPDEFLATVERALKHGKSFKKKTELKIELGKKYLLENVIAESDKMRNVCEMIQKVAPIDLPVTICGQSGTGKTLVARTIHSQGTRKDKPFLIVDCAAFPVPLLELVLFGHVRGAPLTGDAPSRPGLFEAANGGTVLLEEIGSLPLTLQKRLTIVIKTKKLQRVGGHDQINVDARVLVTSNISLGELLKEGMLDENLYALLNVVPIEINQIRERPQDIIPLAYHILHAETGADEKVLPTLSEEVQEMLESYSWPGNVAELVNAIRYAISCATDNMITKDFLPAEITAAYSSNPKKKLDEDELKGKSLKAFINSKKQEYLDKFRPSPRKTDMGTSGSGAKQGRFGTKIRIKPESEPPLYGEPDAK